MKWSFQDIEDKILTLMIQDRAFAVLTIGHLTEEHFEKNGTHPILLNVITKFFNKYKGMPTFEELKVVISANDGLLKKFDFLVAEQIYTQELPPHSIDFIKDNVPKFIKNSQMMQLMREATVRITTVKPEEQDEMLNDFAQKFKQIELYNINHDLGLNLYDVDMRYLMLRRRADIQIKPCINGLARVIGGYAPKELYAYLGESNVGKSILLAMDAFAAVKQGFNVVYVSMEMAEELAEMRMDMNLLGETSKHLLADPSLTDVLKKRYDMLRKNTKAGDLYTKQMPTGSSSCLDIERYLELLRLYKDFVPDFLVVDYGDIMSPNAGKTGKRYEDQGTVFQELRALAQRLDIPVLTATQANRGQYEERKEGKINENRMADSIDKFRILDGCWAVNRKFQKDEEGNKDVLPNDYYLWIAKNRNDIKEVKVDFIMNKSIMMVSDPVEEEVFT